MQKAAFYNAIAILKEGNYRELAKIKEEFNDWEKAWLKLKSQNKVNPEAEWKKLEDQKIKLLLLEDQEYPPLLKEIPHPPFGIYVKGEINSLQKTAFAIVGTRKASTEGKEIAKFFASELSRNGLVIVSGLAFGIDSAAHEGCLLANGETIAVMGNGLGQIYPRYNEKLALKILSQSGAIISEYPIETPPLPYRFLERNRIISGLSCGVLVVEAPQKSGSLITARFALDQNREIFVVPGAIDNKNFEGSNKLIRAGGILTTSPEEILETFNLAARKETSAEIFAQNDDEEKIINILKSTTKPISVDTIIETIKMDAQKVNQTLSFLVIKNMVEEKEGGYMLSNRKYAN